MMPQPGEARRGEARRGKARMMQGCTFLQMQPPLATCYECDSCSLECNAKRVAKKGNTQREREKEREREGEQHRNRYQAAGGGGSRKRLLLLLLLLPGSFNC